MDLPEVASSTEVFEGRSAFVDNLGAIALGILAIGVVYQQYQISSRGGLTNYGIRNLQREYYSSASPSIFSRRRVRKKPEFPGYGLVSAASTAYKAVTSEFISIYTTILTVFPVTSVQKSLKIAPEIINLFVLFLSKNSIFTKIGCSTFMNFRAKNMI